MNRSRVRFSQEGEIMIRVDDPEIAIQIEELFVVCWVCPMHLDAANVTPIRCSDCSMAQYCSEQCKARHWETYGHAYTCSRSIEADAGAAGSSKNKRRKQKKKKKKTKQTGSKTEQTESAQLEPEREPREIHETNESTPAEPKSAPLVETPHECDASDLPPSQATTQDRKDVEVKPSECCIS